MAGNKIAVVDPETGKTGYLDPKFAPEAAQAGVQKASATQIEHAQQEADAEATLAARRAPYEGFVEGTALPFAAGVARGATVGASDFALGTFGGAGVRKRLLDYQEFSPGASLVGEGVGIVAPAVFGDEAGVANIPGMVGRVGARAEASTAASLGGGLGARLVGKALSGATEGAIYAGGKAAGDAALHNEQLTTEKAVSAMGHGALFGGGTNVLLGGAGAGLSKLLGREEGAAAGLASRVEGGTQREATSLGDSLQKAADVKTVKALGGSAGDLSALERSTPGGFRRVAQDIRGDVEASTGKSIGFHNKESLHEYATKRVDELGDKLGGMLKKLDEAKSGIAPDVQSFAQKVREEIVTPNVAREAQGAVPSWSDFTKENMGSYMREHGGHGPAMSALGRDFKGLQESSNRILKPGAAPVVNAAESWLGEVEAAFGSKAPTFTEWQQARRGLDKQINFAARNASPEMDALKQIRGMMEKELEVSGEAAAKNVGGRFADEYQATKSLYQSVRKAQELTERGVARELANNSFGLGATIGAATGLATGGPLGSIAMGLAGKVIKDRGDMMAADLLHRAANIAGVQSLAARTDATIASGVSKLLGAKAPVAATAASAVRVPVAPMGVALSGNLRGDYKKVSQAVVQAQANPAQTTDRVAKALGPEAGKSPKVAAAATNLMLGDIAYLHQQMPPPRRDAFSLQGHLQQESRASESEMSKWLSQAAVLASPTIVIDKANEGTLSRSDVETLKARRPEMYEAIRTEVLEQVTSTTKEIPYDKRIQLGILLDIPTDRTLAPDFQQAIQATYSSAEQAETESPSPQLARPLAIASGPMTSLQAAMSEGLEK